MSKHEAQLMRDDIVAEASLWFVELNENPQDQTIRESFDRWLRESPEHVRAFLQVSVHWEEGRPRAGATVESIGELLTLAKTDMNVVRLAPRRAVPRCPEAGFIQDTSSSSVAHATATRDRSRRQRSFAWAAAILLGIVGGALVWQQVFRGVYSSGVGEQRSLTLADGSTVELNSRSRLRVRYTPYERHIDLLEGQALFQVAKNRLRPFIVQSGSAQVRAVGTRFDVYRTESDTIVTVVEGRVAVIPEVLAQPNTGATATQSPSRTLNDRESANKSGATGGMPTPSAESKTRESAQRAKADAAIFLDSGEQIRLGRGATAAAAPARLEPANIEAAIAWTQHRLIFKGAPLSEVVSEFNRYSERRMIVTDPEIAATRISGSFSSSDPTDLLRFLREVGAYDVRETPASISISRR